MNTVSPEFLKLRTTRVPYVLLFVTVAIAGIAAAGLVGSDSLDDDRALALAQGATFGTMFATVLGILLVTNEYRHGTVMTTFLVEPRRVRVLAAKLVTALLTGVGFGLASAAVAAAVALPWLASKGESLPLDGQALEGLVRLVLAFALSTALGAAVGAIVQSQVGTIVAVFVWFLIAESLVGVLSSWLLTELGEPDPVSRYLPGSALGGVVGGQGSEYMLRGPASTLLAVAYVATLAVVGAFVITRRDP
ncbi:MAG TPA: ABC transporter permease [Gaiellaceae bacterium]|nr:ABC transporter permease [Gaiellaceae bacterium]